jgi:hypothetical protein
VTFFYLEEEKVKKEIDQDGSGLDHGQQQPGSKQLMGISAENKFACIL